MNLENNILFFTNATNILYLLNSSLHIFADRIFDQKCVLQHLYVYYPCLFKWFFCANYNICF